MSSSLDLARTLRLLDAASLAELLRIRLSSVAGLRDYFDVADALLTPASIHRGLARIPAPALGDPASHLAVFTELGLAGADGLYPEVADELAVVTAPLSGPVSPTADNLGPDVSALAPANVAAIAAEYGLTTVGAIDNLLRALTLEPAKILSRGGVSTHDQARLGRLIETGHGALDDYLHLAAAAGILSADLGYWEPRTGDALTHWHQAALDERWVRLAAAWQRAFVGNVTELLTSSAEWGAGLVARVQQNFPLGHDWLDEKLAAAVAQGQLLGLATPVAGILLRSPLMVALESEGAASAQALVTAALPPAIDSVYVQHDLSIVAPGPLPAHVARRLGQLCIVESHGLAATYRLHPAGITAALLDGMTADEILDLLQSISSTPLPQPVTYLVTETAQRCGSIRVSTQGTGAVISCTDSTVAKAIQADSGLRVLDVTPLDEHTLATPRDAQHAVLSLQAERYPALLENDDGSLSNVIAPRPPRTDKVPTVDPMDALVVRLAGLPESSADDNDAWTTRQIDLAIREKAAIVIAVTMPDGEREFTVIPKGLTNGRLRTRDAKTDVERTLPLSSITALHRV